MGYKRKVSYSHNSHIQLYSILNCINASGFSVPRVWVLCSLSSFCQSSHVRPTDGSEDALRKFQVMDNKFCRRLLLFVWQRHNKQQISCFLCRCTSLLGKLLLCLSELTEIRVGTPPSLLDQIPNRSLVPIALPLFELLASFVFQIVIIVVSWVRQELLHKRDFMKKLHLFSTIHSLAVWTHHIQLYTMPAFCLGSPTIPFSQMPHSLSAGGSFFSGCGCVCRFIRFGDGVTAILVVGLLRRLPFRGVPSRSWHSQSCPNTATVKSGKRMLVCNNPPKTSSYLTVAIVEAPTPWTFFTKPYPSN
jgi:hypothetical protein